MSSLTMDDLTYYVYDENGNKYKVVAEGSWVGGDYENVTIYGSDGERVYNNSLGSGDMSKSAVKDFVKTAFASNLDDFYGNMGSTTTGYKGGETEIYGSEEEAYAANYGTLDETATFDELYAAQGNTVTGMPEGWQGGEINVQDELKNYAMETFGINADEYGTMTPLTMEPVADFNKKYQEDVGLFSSQLKETMASINTEIGGVQSGGGFSGDSGAITQPLDTSKTLAEQSAMSAYDTLSSNRFSDISKYKRESMDAWMQEGFDFGKG